jgi:hypothetical protein
MPAVSPRRIVHTMMIMSFLTAAAIDGCPVTPA